MGMPPLQFKYTTDPDTNRITLDVVTDRGRISCKHLETEDGKEFARLSSISDDINIIVEIIELIKLERAGDRIGSLHIFTDSLLIRYRRCFTNGRRGFIPKHISILQDPKYAETHRRLYALADKYVAHQVSNLDVYQAYAGVYSEPQEEEHLIVGVFVAGRFSFELSDLNDILELVQRLKAEHVVPELEVARKRYTDFVKSITIEELRALPDVSIKTNDYLEQ